MTHDDDAAPQPDELGTHELWTPVNNSTKERVNYPLQEELFDASMQLDAVFEDSALRRDKASTGLPAAIDSSARRLDGDTFWKFMRNSQDSQRATFATTSMNMVEGNMPLGGYSGMFGPSLVDDLVASRTKLAVKYDEDDPYFGAGSATGYGTGFESKLAKKSSRAYGQRLADARVRGHAPYTSVSDEHPEPAANTGEFIDHDDDINAGAGEDAQVRTPLRQQFLQTAHGLKALKSGSRKAPPTPTHKKGRSNRRESSPLRVNPVKLGSTVAPALAVDPRLTHRSAENGRATRSSTRTATTSRRPQSRLRRSKASTKAHRGELDKVLQNLASGQRATKLRQQLEATNASLAMSQRSLHQSRAEWERVRKEFDHL